MADTWPEVITKGKHVAEAIDWVRWRTRDRIRLVIAIGANSIAVAKPRELDPEDAIAFLADLQDEIAGAIRQLHREKLTHIAIRSREK